MESGTAQLLDSHSKHKTVRKIQIIEQILTIPQISNLAVLKLPTMIYQTHTSPSNRPKVTKCSNLF